MTKEEMKELLGEFKEEIAQNFKEINQNFKQIDTRFKQIDARFERVEEKIELYRREAMTMFEHIIHEIVPPVAEGVADVPTLREEVVDIRQGLGKLDGKVTALTFHIQNNHEARIASLEERV